ncbi:MAG: glutathione peroxidase [Ferruginibacter sp.]|nr:glutathione peroxidase [Ferruginibacter sp.]
MTTRQKILKAVYPAMIWFTKLTGTNTGSLGKTDVIPLVSIYSLLAVGNNGKPVHISDFKGKKILLVNTASDCGYTGQYATLETLYRQHANNLVILGFPANDFKEQEKGTDETIASFCKVNYGVTFPLMQKSKVVKGADQNEIFQWLSDKNKNGWNDQAPTWNFCKYLVDEQGKLVHFFASSVEPLSEEILKAIDE